MKTKLKSYNDKINTYLYGKKLPKENSPCYCVATVLDSESRIKNEININK